MLSGESQEYQIKRASVPCFKIDKFGCCHYGLGMNVFLTPELEKFVAAKVESGLYHSASEVVREALRLLEDRDQAKAERHAEFNQEPGCRLESLDQGHYAEPEAVRARLKRKSASRRPA